MTGPAAGTAVAVDIGGTKIAVALVDASGAVVHRHQVPTPAADGETVWRAVDGALDTLLAGDRLRGCVGVGVGTAGPVERATRTASPVNIGGWRRFPVGDRLAARFPDLPVRLANDAVCMAVGEHWRGVGVGCDDLVGVVVSTGVGAGLVLGGRPHVGPSGNAGHLGHASVDLDGEPCACGGVGCLETVASGPSILRWARANGYAGEPAVPALAAAATAGDTVAAAAFARAGRALGAAFAWLATVVDVRVAVVGGGVANVGDLLLAPTRAALDRYAALGYTAGFEVRRAALGGDAGLVGAAALVLEPQRYGAAVT